jgi:hypothetical protein
MILSLLACVRVGVRICLFSSWLVCLRRMIPRSIIHLTDCVMPCFFSQAAIRRSCSQLFQSTTLQSLARLGKNRLSPRSSAHLTQGRSGPRLFWSLANSVLGGSVLGPSPLALTNACPLQRSYALALSRSGTRLLQRSVLRCHSFMPHAFVHAMFILH